MTRMGPFDDSHLPLATSLLEAVPRRDRQNVGLLGISTHATSVTPRSPLSTPAAVRTLLTYFTTWSCSDQVDLGDTLSIVDYGDVEDPDGEGGSERIARAVVHFDQDLALRIILGGDNAATWHALRAIGGGEISSYGLVTLDAHYDLRGGQTNCSHVRQLLDAGVEGNRVVQVGLADFSSSEYYARRAHEAGITVITRDQLRRQPIEEAAERAMEIAGDGGRRVYVDIDMNAAELSVAPGSHAAAPGGLSADEMRRFVRTITTDPRVSAIDITEIDVDRDSHDQRTVRLAALLVLEALAGVRRR
jgi:formiminoglutamase